jgi:hypothetical protein
MANRNKVTKILFVTLLLFVVSLSMTLVAEATQNSGYGYGYGENGYGYGYGYWSEATPTVALTYGSCTTGCYTGGSQSVTITATFASAVSGTPDIAIDYAGSTTDVTWTAMAGSGATWTYSWLTPEVSADDVTTVSVRTLSGSGYTPTPTNATVTVLAPAAGTSGGSIGGGTPSATPSTGDEAPAPTEVVITETATVTLTEAGAAATMSVGSTMSFSAAGGSHSLAVNSVDMAAGTASVTISSDPVTLDLATGVMQSVDINGDGIADLEVTLQEIISATDIKLLVKPVTTSNEIPMRSSVLDLDAEKAGLSYYIGLNQTLPSGTQWQVVHFIAYGTVASSNMSVRDRQGVIGDYYEVYGRVPNSNADWQDVANILTSHMPTQRKLAAEQQALMDFVKVYKRLPDFSSANDEWAMYYIAYKIRNVVRNIDSEKAAIGTFRNVYGYSPSSSHHWAVMRAIAYTGAAR